MDGPAVVDGGCDAVVDGGCDAVADGGFLLAGLAVEDGSCLPAADRGCLMAAADVGCFFTGRDMTSSISKVFGFRFLDGPPRLFKFDEEFFFLHGTGVEMFYISNICLNSEFYSIKQKANTSSIPIISYSHGNL